MSESSPTFDQISADQRMRMLHLAERVAGVGHWLIDLRNESVFWSDEIYRIHGVDPETYTPDIESAIDFYHPGDADHVRTAVERAIADKRAFEFEFRLIRPSGEIRHVHSKSEIQTDDSGDVVAIFGIFEDVTDKRHIEAQLIASEDRFDIAARGANIGLWDVDLRTEDTYWSPRFREILGITDEAFKPSLDEFSRRLHPDDRERVLSTAAAHISERREYDTEYRMRREDGSYVWIHTHGQGIWSGDGAPVRIAGSAIDINDRKRDELMRADVYRLLTNAELSPNEHIQHLLAIGLLYLDLDMGIVSEIKNDVYRVIHVEDRTESLKPDTEFDLGETYCWHALRGDGVTAFDHAGASEISGHPCYKNFGLESYIGIPIRIAGSVFGTLNFSSATRRDAAFGPREKSFVAMLSQWIAYEIGAQQQLRELTTSREVLKQQEAELQLIFDTVPVRIWFKDDRNRILRLNTHAAASMGMTVAEAEGADTYDLFPEMAKKYHDDDLEVLDSGKARLNIVEKYTPRLGESGWVRTDKVPFADPVDAQRRIVVLAQDITELMRTQEALEAKTELLKETNKDLDDFAYIASHDLRAPLRGVENLAEWIEEDLGDLANDDIREHLALLRNRVSRMDRMLEDILAYSRAGRDVAAPERIDSGALLAEVVDWITTETPFDVSVAEKMPVLVAPKTTLQQLFQNLISNAVKHHDRPDGKVMISAVETPDSYKFSVADDGPGIPEKYRERVFKMFEKLDRRDEVEGSGIGLAIVDRLVRSIGGGVVLESSHDGRGSRFQITIPKLNETEDLQNGK